MTAERRPKASVMAKPRRWRFSADQYQQMGEAGIFQAEDRVELLAGEIYQMTPIGSWHNAEVDVLNRRFVFALGDKAIVRVQGSFRLAEDSEPEPDLLLLRPRGDFYRSALPGPDDVLLVIEVADKSLGYDRNLKLPLYAAGAIAEVWIVNRTEEQIELYREPRGDSYESVSVLKRGDVVASLAFPEIAIDVDEIFGKAE
jgi:Uma2 family endonuclease